ncbi:uncharacterized protein BX663DRAFT_549237 [Cokeromyces recurvatus]|uniref:uncharacterized protein n=1 Tax=Cokeromyces recurvatus TaxID=90255 RepID=UPI00221EDC3A|nr:uncharacterized protein BX663DRAFT_549237 [Cokeromyces recurvatus]KAI7906132.1 hypothetical protein BX663DRAFT_549237 [Cokeromyces recurvatus]
METPIGVLRIEQNQVSKELSRFRACDPETRSLYCREWAQYIYKKHFVWSAKTQEEIPDSHSAPVSISTGKYQINFINNNANDDEEEDEDEQVNIFKKERSVIMAKKFEDLLKSWSTVPAKPEEESLINQLIQACQLWITLPSGYSGLPTLFEPIEFNPYPDAIPLTDDPKDPSQLLDALIIERQALCLPSDCFHLLKNLTGDILLSHTTPTCNHVKPTSRSPSDLDVDRNIFNENETVAVKKALADLTVALDKVWQPLNNFLDKLTKLEKRRSKLLGQDCQATINSFVDTQKYVSLLDLWALEEPKYKNKKSTPDVIASVDEFFEQRLGQLKLVINSFMDDFVPAHMKEIQILTADLWQMIVPTIYEMGERMATHEDQKGNKNANANATKVSESLKALNVDSLKRMESTKEVETAQTRILESLKSRKNRYIIDIDNLLKNYQESRSTLHGRVERLNNKDFKKKIKKVEGQYEKLRQYFLREVTATIFPETLFCKFALVCLEPLMQEAEVMEAVTIEREVKRFVEAHKDLLQQRCTLLHDFEEGVQTGRRELAGVLGKLFLKEGMRIQGDSAALKKQNSLLKSMGLSVDEPTTASSKKKSKNKKKSSSGVNSGASSSNSTPTMASKDLPIASPDKKNIEKKKKADTTSPPAKSVAVTKEQNVPPPKNVSPKPVHVKPIDETAATKKFPKTDVSVLVNMTQSNNIKKDSGKDAPTAESNVATNKIKEVSSTKTETLLKQSEPSNQNDDIQDWETIRTSVMANESKKNEVNKDEIQDWETLKANVQKKEEKEPTKVNKKDIDNWNKTTHAGWSTVAAKKPAIASASASTNDNWSTTATVNTSENSSAKGDDLGGWGSPIVVVDASKSAAWPNTSTDGKKTSVGNNEKENDGWNTAKKEKKKHSKTATSAWNAPTSNLPVSDDDGGLSLGGWGSSSTTDNWNKPSNVGTDSWNKSSTSSPTTDTWNKSTSSSPINDGWNVTKTLKKKQSINNDDGRGEVASTTPTSDNWGKPATTSSSSSNDDGWGVISNPAEHTSTVGWDSSNLPWNDEPATTDAQMMKVSTKEHIKKSNDTISSIPPGISNPTPMPTPPPGITNTTITSTSRAMPPGLNAINDEANKKVEELPTTSSNPSTNNTTAIIPTPGLATSSVPNNTTVLPTGLGMPLLSSAAVQLQEPLPANINEMSADMLLLIVKNLHRENGTLIQSVYSMQQEMSMMTNRYAEIMALAREREAQTLALFESRKQTEMEEARRYVLSLEARVKQLEEQLSKPHSTNMTTAGFGNQDLFAGYREEMSTSSHHHNNHNRNNHHNRKLWQKNTIIRCGNCGEMGHASAECKSYCRYCGSLEHLSEACPMN